MTGKAVAKVEPTSAIEEFMREFGNTAAPVGLEDVGSDDLALAVIKIDHIDAVFVDSLTGEKYDELDCVLLGLLKQRVMWDPDPEVKTGPLCKSRDAKIGNPREAFPWDVYRQHGGTAATGSGTLECGTCSLAKWGTNPKNDTPWCSSQYTFPVVIGDADGVSGLLSLQRSGIAPSKQYISGFMRDRMPLFAYRTKITLEQNRKGTVKFCTPKFERGAAVEDITQLQAWASSFESIRGLVHSTDVSDSTVVSAPVPTTATPAYDDPWATASPQGSDDEVIDGEFIPQF